MRADSMWFFVILICVGIKLLRDIIIEQTFMNDFNREARKSLEEYKKEHRKRNKK